MFRARSPPPGQQAKYAYYCYQIKCKGELVKWRFGFQKAFFQKVHLEKGAFSGGTETLKSYGFEMTWGWVIDEKTMPSFVWNCENKVQYIVKNELYVFEWLNDQTPETGCRKQHS